MSDDLPQSVALVPARSQALQQTIGDAISAQVTAQVQARYALAQRYPRDPDAVRQAVLKECRRPAFAARARYAKPIGESKPVEGPSIRFVEAALRLCGHMYTESAVIYDDERQRVVRVTVCDALTNTTHSQDVTLEKTVERRSGAGRQVIAERKNKGGQTVYVVVATEDEVIVKQASLVSKAMRTCGLRLLPGDLVDEAQTQVIATRSKGGADPDATRKAVCDDYASLGIGPEEVREYVGHDLAQLNPGELDHLAGLSAAIRDGEATWAEAIALRRTERQPAPTQQQEEGRQAALGLKPPKK